MKKLFERILFRLGYSRTEHLAQARAALLHHAFRAHDYEEMLFKSEQLTQRGIRIIEELRRVNKELARAVRRNEFEMRVRRPSGLIEVVSNESDR